VLEDSLREDFVRQALTTTPIRSRPQAACSILSQSGKSPGTATIAWFRDLFRASARGWKSNLQPRVDARSVFFMTTGPALDALQTQRRAVIRWLRPLAPLILAVVAVSAFTSSPGPASYGRGLSVTVALAVVLLAGLAAVLTAGRPSCERRRRIW
jgi:hypothetical protein